MSKKIGYKDAGVDIAAGEEAVDRIKELVRSTFTAPVLTDLGQFGDKTQGCMSGRKT